MARVAAWLAGAAAVAVAAAAAAAVSMNPCHGSKQAEAAAACERVQMPSGLCRACPLRPPRPDGNFQDCARIYDLDAPGCKGKFEEYVKLNPCDTRRKELVGKWGKGGKERLDYFAYALCELTCDTIEKGSKLEEYEQRNKETRLWSLKRGNGPAHLAYDVCTVFPSFKFWALPGPNGNIEDHYDYPKVCPLLQKWLGSDASKNWVAQTNVQVVPEITRAISDAMWALEAHDYKTWKRCLQLEATQKRV
jgi:hypothetical protein